MTDLPTPPPVPTPPPWPGGPCYSPEVEQLHVEVDAQLDRLERELTAAAVTPADLGVADDPVSVALWALSRLDEQQRREVLAYHPQGGAL